MARKFALLLGISQYKSGLKSLPSAARDVEAMQRVLQHSDMGSFDAVKSLINPEPPEMQRAIEELFLERDKDDLVVLFFSGHGIRDESGRLHLATSITERSAQGQLSKSTAVPARFIHEIMDDSRSKRQVIILDCCFSGAFAQGLSAKDDGFIDVRSQLGGEGRAVLTSSTSTQYSFEQEGSDLSIYTRYLIEGIETGGADLDGDSFISVEELHEYAGRRVQAVSPAMKPEIYAVKEGYKIHLAKAPADDPTLNYRREVEQWISNGKISETARVALEDKRNNLRLSRQETAAIEAGVLEPYVQYDNRLKQYKQLYLESIQSQYPLSREVQADLQRFTQRFDLKIEDVELAEKQLNQSVPRDKSTPVWHKIVLASGAVAIVLTVMGFAVQHFLKAESSADSSELKQRAKAFIEKPNDLNKKRCESLLEMYLKHQDVRDAFNKTEESRNRCKEDFNISIPRG
jgi:uncharacterized caspase-like protein